MPDGPQTVRSVVAVGAGFFAIQMLSLGGQKVLGAGSLPMTLALWAVCDVIGGYITAHLAVIRPVKHAAVLGAFTLVLSLVLALLAWGTSIPGAQIAALLLIVPLATLGGKLRELQVRHGSGG